MDDDPTQPTEFGLPPSQWAIGCGEEPTAVVNVPPPPAASGFATEEGAPLLAPLLHPQQEPYLGEALPLQQPYLGEAKPLPPGAEPAPLRAAGPALRAPGPSGWCVSVVLLNLVALGLVLCLAAGATTTPVLASAGAAYLVYALVALCSPSGEALRNCMTQGELDAYVGRVRRAAPTVTASIVCYHYESRREKVHYKDSEGKERHRHVTRTVRVDTHSASESWAYAWCRDVSGPPVYQPHLAAVRVHIVAVQDFTGAPSRAAFDRWKAHFFARHTRDAHQDRSCRMSVPGLRSHVLLRREEGGLLSAGAHTLAVLLLCGGLYEACVLTGVPSVRWGLVKQLHAH